VDELKVSGKPFVISKWEVQEAYRRVKANKGAAGVDGVSLTVFEEDLKNNLYRIWNRMASGTYFPPAVKAVEIPKAHGGVRILGVPTVADRIAQTVVAMELERRVEPIFHPDSYGYRPGRSALDAVGQARRRCWKSDWVIDLDIQKFFDSVPWDLVVKAVQAHTDLPWVVLYVQRWLEAPLQHADGTLQQRDRGTPQGSAVSPVLANLFLHYAFDTWMVREFPTVQWERYVDDAVIHCVSERQARTVLAALTDRMSEVGLQLHPDKTRIVYCRDGKRRGGFNTTEFTFLGFTFRARGAGQARQELHVVPARDQQGSIDPDQYAGAELAAAQAYRSGVHRPRTLDESHRAGLDPVLRRLLQVGVVPPPATHQCLPDALDPQEVQTAACVHEGPGVLAGGYHSVPPHVRPLGGDARGLVTRMTRAV